MSLPIAKVKARTNIIDVIQIKVFYITKIYVMLMLCNIGEFVTF